MGKFALRLKELRTAKGLSQQGLSDQLGIVSKSSINMYERGEREPGLDTLEAIADYFNVDMDYLLGSSSEPVRYPVRAPSSAEKPAADIGSGLTESEATLLDLFRCVPPNKQGMILEMIQVALRNQG